MHSTKECPPVTRLVSRSCEISVKFSRPPQTSVGPPHRTNPGSLCAGAFHGLIASPPVPPDIDMKLDRYSLRTPTSCDVHSAPALTPTLETQFELTLSCDDTQLSM